MVKTLLSQTNKKCKLMTACALKTVFWCCCHSLQHFSNRLSNAKVYNKNKELPNMQILNLSYLIFAIIVLG